MWGPKHRTPLTAAEELGRRESLGRRAPILTLLDQLYLLLRSIVTTDTLDFNVGGLVIVCLSERCVDG